MTSITMVIGQPATSGITATIGDAAKATLYMGIQGPPGAGLNVDKPLLERTLAAVEARTAPATPDVHEHDIVSEESLNRQKRVLDAKIAAINTLTEVLVQQLTK